jgi:hypothetical protein
MTLVLVAVERNSNSVMDAPKAEPTKIDSSHPDYYLEDGFCVFTSTYLVRKGSCCGSGCRHCPYQPKHSRGSVKLRKEVLKNL